MADRASEPRTYLILRENVETTDGVPEFRLAATADGYSPASALRAAAAGNEIAVPDGEYVVIAESHLHRLPVRRETRVQLVIGEEGDGTAPVEG